jgi:hypothetical protein
MTFPTVTLPGRAERGDRIASPFAALHESGFGTKRPCAGVPFKSALKGKADEAFSGPDSRS